MRICKKLAFSLACTTQYIIILKTFWAKDWKSTNTHTRLLSRNSRKLDENLRKFDFSFSTTEVLETAKRVLVLGLCWELPTKTQILVWVLSFNLTFTAKSDLNLRYESESCHENTGFQSQIHNFCTQGVLVENTDHFTYTIDLPRKRVWKWNKISSCVQTWSYFGYNQSTKNLWFWKRNFSEIATGKNWDVALPSSFVTRQVFIGIHCPNEKSWRQKRIHSVKDKRNSYKQEQGFRDLNSFASSLISIPFSIK